MPLPLIWLLFLFLVMAVNSGSLKWSSSSSTQSPGVIEDSDFCPLEQMSRREQTMRRSTFRVQDYSWEDHGYSLSNRLYTEIGTLFDEKLNVAKKLTYHRLDILNCLIIFLGL